MVQLIKIDRLGPRIEGMAYRAKFDEAYGLLEVVSAQIGRVHRTVVDGWDQSSKKLIEAGRSLLSASYFKELMSVGGVIRCRAVNDLASPSLFSLSATS